MSVSKFWKEAIQYRLGGGHLADHQAMIGTLAPVVGPMFFPKTYGALENGSDDTAAIQAAINAASIAYNATTKVRATVYFNGVNYGITGLLLKPNVILNFGQAYFKKLANGTTVASNSMLRTVDTLIGGTTYYGNYDNIDIIGGTFDTNGFTCPAQILRLENVRVMNIKDTTVIHSSACQSWAFQIGGQRITADNLTVLNGSLIYQDGIHVTHGDQIRINGGYVTSGDDGIAFGTDCSSSVETWDDEALTNVTVNGVRLNAQHGSIKVYYGMNTATGMPFSGVNRGKINGLVITGCTGNTGILGNGAIYITDTTTITFTAALVAATSATLVSAWTGTSGVYNVSFSNNVRAVTFTNGSTALTWTGAVTSGITANAGDASRIKNVSVVDFNLNSGSAANDGVSAAGFLIRYATNVTIRGTLNLTNTTNGNLMSAADILQCYGGDVSVKIPMMPSGPGIQIRESQAMELHGCRLIGGTASRASVEITGSQDAYIHHNQLYDIPSNGAGVMIQSVGSGNLVNTLTMDSNVIRKAAGATITRAYSQQSSGIGFMQYLSFTNNDLRGTNNATAIDQAWNGTGITPDLFIVGNNRSAVNAITPYLITASAAVTIPAVSGQRLAFSAMSANMTLTAPSLSGLFIGFTIDMTFTQDATAGRTITWPATFKFYSAAWTDAVVTTDANKSTSIRAVFDGTNFIVQSPNRWL